MFLISRWLSLYWFVLLPITSLAAAVLLYRRQRIQLSRKASRWCLLALLASQVYVDLLIANSFYDTALWPAGCALLVVPVITTGRYFAAKGLSPDPAKSFGRSSYVQGMNGKKVGLSEWASGCLVAARVASLFIFSAVISAYILLQQVMRWPGLWLIPLALFCPSFILSRGRRYVRMLPLSLTLIALAFGLQSAGLRRSLPPGQWTTPITSVSCSNTIHLDLDRKYAWCADERTGWIYQFLPASGIVGQGLIVDNGAQAFAGNTDRVLVMQNPLSGLVLVENGQQTRIKINLARQGTVDRIGRLWVIDVTGTLWVAEPNREWKRLRASDGLLDNTANVVKTSPDGAVWVGSIGGVSRLAAGSLEWQHVIRSNNLPGPVQDFAFTTDGKVWYLWEAASAYRDRVRWGVSSWQGYRWSHVELGAETGLDYPPSSNAFAVDGRGRVWFVAPSYIQKANFLGILEPNSGLISLYVIGPFDVSPGEGFPIPGYNGVLDDGSGGIFIYNPAFAPLRHWRLDQELEEFHPCVAPCGTASILNPGNNVTILERGKPEVLNLE